ncbi:MAG: recombinase family protein [Candidatus Bathyarchaeota archaeon]|nr:recombinase family protein [Candidatus Termiticorpusculum sp.]MCL2291800.1 recombinase family protein [Candidatus Termiticorpusculum sp.]
MNSLENQKRYFEQYINNNLDWQFCGLYVDEGISGTSVEKRVGFKKMIADAENKKFDLLLTKEISRFARNTLDSIFYTRKLKDLGVGVFFMNDNINTLDADAELRLTMMSSIAQEESRKTSERVKWGQKRQMERGFAFGVSAFGYNTKNGKLTINEDEAKTVKLIFDLYLSGIGIYSLQKELENRGIPSPSGSPLWVASTVRVILKNEKYTGTLKQKKTLTTNYLTHKRKTNEGEEKYIIVENNHAPIVDKETFDKVQSELQRRRSAVFENTQYSNRYVWSGKIECAMCKSKFGRRHNETKPNPPQIVWRCSQSVQYGREKINAQGQKVGCNNKAVHEEFLKENFLAVLNTVINNKDLVIQELKTAVCQEIAKSPNNADEMKSITSDIERITARKGKLIDTYVDGLITKAEFEQTNNRYSTQVEGLKKQLLALELGNETVETLQQKLEKIETVIENLARLKEFGDSICGELLHKVIVDGREKISFYLLTDKNADMFVKMPVSVSKGYHQQPQHPNHTAPDS